MILSIAQLAISEKSLSNDYFYNDTDYFAAQYIYVISVWVQNVADVFYAVVFIMLISSMKSFFSGGGTHPAYRLIHYFWLAILMLINIAVLGIGIATYAVNEAGTGYIDFTIFFRVSGAWTVLYWPVTLSILIPSAIVLSKASKASSFPTSKALLVVLAAIVNFVRYLFLLITAILWSLELKNAPIGVYYLDPLFYNWLTVIMAALLVFAGIGDAWFDTPAPIMQQPMAPAPVAYYPPPQQHPAGQWQWVPHQSQGVAPQYPVHQNGAYGNVPHVQQQNVAPGIAQLPTDATTGVTTDDAYKTA
jgi:hypothetical protein